MKTIKGRLTIARCSDDTVMIRLDDDAAGVTAVEIALSLLGYANAITNRGNVPCAFEFNDSGLVGTVREYKTEKVFVPECWEASSKESVALVALAPLEVDGWVGRHSDTLNWHNRTGDPPPNGKKGSWYKVLFERWRRVSK